MLLFQRELFLCLCTSISKLLFLHDDNSLNCIFLISSLYAYSFNLNGENKENLCKQFIS